ncbi:hypothetical protein IWQ60_009585 [Tieghemiomyces parasiticus]|uniref:Cytosol aminopeptidase domain-containing protein n=1 Tax=Tieghemiomyces parasiticus TaxID=78921 RepID=A0A9W7ZT94_9FUNG|nr:hypothetical protein IWQ60_009585 [Tieghemiomyces parasiticus]
MAIPKLTVLKDAAFQEQSVAGSAYDALVVVFTDAARLTSSNMPFTKAIQAVAAVDPSVGQQVSLLYNETVPGGRLVTCPTGSLNDDTDDVRKFSAACRAATARAHQSGARRVLYYFLDPPQDLPGYEKWLEVSLLGIFAESYITLVVRRHQELTKQQRVGDRLDEIAFFANTPNVSTDSLNETTRSVLAIEKGRRVHLDMGYGDPEQMTPLNCAQYIQDTLASHPNLRVTVLTDLATIGIEYPLLHAVARASILVPRHRPCVVTIEYTPSDPSAVREHAYLVGKGVTYDTGGIDLKTGGAMRGMSRDKLGATSVAGVMAAIAELAPSHLRVTAELAFVRNSIGADGYLSDEVLYSRTGKRVLIGNTDAEGRLIMTDLLSQCRERVLAQRTTDPRPVHYHIYTVATLTGHVIRAYGHYGAFLSNGPAVRAGVPDRLIQAGERWGDPYEQSRLRPDDFAKVAPGSDREDVCQTDHMASSATARGHQYPAAYLIIAAGLKPHGNAAKPEEQVCYTHVDIAGSAEEAHSQGMSLCNLTGNPVPSLTAALLDL